ncbi:MAG: hypothetical protein ABIO67_05005 [Mycobacteriales bacterium]
MRRLLLGALGLGVLALELTVAYAYQVRGTWWHFLLHQYIGWGLGLAAGALIMVATRRRVPVIAALLLGQLVSIVPDLMFRFMRMPHTAWMDLWVGHISIHRGPSPLLVATAVLLLGGLAWLLTSVRPAYAVVVALLGPILLTGACLAAKPLPTRLSDFGVDTVTVVPR